MPDQQNLSKSVVQDVIPDQHNQDDFDEIFYLTQHADIAEGIQKGYFRDGWDHYTNVGSVEGRAARFGGFDVGFYRQSYPLASEEVSDGHAENLRSHYHRLGIARGYIPNPTALRPDNPVSLRSRFGGLWLDRPDALDLISGKGEVGYINADEAASLCSWVENGYVVLPNCIPEPILQAASDAMELAYSGKNANLLFECPEAVGSRDFSHWLPDMNNYPAKALDLHFQSPAIRDLQFAPAIARFLDIVFESKALASQTLGFWRGSAQEGHQDTAYVAYTRPRNFVASWIALEDVSVGAGELFYYEGSHTFDDFLYGGSSKTIHDCRRMNGGVFPSGEAAAFIKSLRDRAEQNGMSRKMFVAKRGDALIWHADLVHGGSSVSNAFTRKSVVTHYCPVRLAPLYFEDRPVKVHCHGNNRFSSGIYLHADPQF